MADNENDSPPKQIAAELLARDSDKALGIAWEQWRRAEKLGDSAAADAWRRIARAIALIELERLRHMLDETSGVTGSDTYPAATHVTVAADRDEAPKSDGRLGSHAFDSSQFVDRYEQALKKLIADKKKGRNVTEVDEPETTNVVDLMAALRASLAAKDKEDGKPARKPKTAAKKPTTTPKARKAS